MQVSFDSQDADETAACARLLAGAIGESSPAGAFVIALLGDLGAGKTAFVKGLAAGFGIDSDVVSSPTFVLANQYESPDGVRLHHVDLYRLESVDELETMGFFDMLEPGAVVAVEWADRHAEALPADRLEIRIARPGAASVDATGESGRRVFEVQARGPAAAKALDAWRSAFERD